MTDAIILAGGTIEEDDLRQEAGVDYKALIPLAGQPMLEYVLRAFRDATRVGRIVVVGPPILKSHPAAQLADIVLEEAATRAENLFLGIEALPEADRILMATADTPLLTPAIVDELLEQAPVCDICYPFVAKETVLKDFGERKWVFVKLRDGSFTGSSMALFRPAAFQQIRPLVEQVFGAHRDHMKVARLFGLPFLLRSSAGWITVPEIEAHVSRVVGLDCRGYLARHAELAFDVDHLGDISFALRRLAPRP